MWGINFFLAIERFLFTISFYDFLLAISFYDFFLATGESKLYHD